LAQFLLARGQMAAAREQAAFAMNIDSTRVDSYTVLAAVYAFRGQQNELAALLTAADRQVPDDLSPYFRAAEVLLSSGRDLDGARRYFRRYLDAEPEGNAPTWPDARGKLDLVLAKRKEISGTSALPAPGSAPAR
jgi:tetratricopeptide (TPR) repeat protein